jgi:hypothetical protein
LPGGRHWLRMKPARRQLTGLPCRLFAAADPLLKAAPWAFVRGNHEVCSRGGEGWNRMLAPYAFDPASCKTNEEPYILKLPGFALAVMDVADAREKALGEEQALLPRTA